MATYWDWFARDGDPQQSAVILLDDADAERFLDPAGWAGSGTSVVNTASDNRYPDIDFLAISYGGADPARAASQFWYHAEVYSADRLGTLLRGRDDIDQKRFSQLKDPALVCYYLFFPGHEQPLEGCDSMAGRRWGSCAGAWACVAVLLQGDGNHNNYKPSMIGLTASNAGVLDFLGQERRVGMPSSIGT